jgi:hypothetical protein
MTIGLKTMLKIMFLTSVVYLFTVAEKQSHEDSSHFAVVVIKISRKFTSDITGCSHMDMNWHSVGTWNRGEANNEETPNLSQFLLSQ